MKKIFALVLCFLILLSHVYAYDFEREDNKSKVNSDIDEIYGLKELYEEFVGVDENDVVVEYEEANVDAYWWPIGSTSTTTSNGKKFAADEPEKTVISSYFGYRGAVIDSNGNQISGNANHGALDIANSTGVGKTNIIASKSGTVVFPTEKDKTNCVQGDNGCNDGYGNYVIIQHSDGNYTLYAHLHANTITVKAGETVEQGQVIGLMGSSGNSTDSHLHFEVRLGENTREALVDPLDYVDMDNPRPKSSNGDLMDFVKNMEGSGPTDGDYYIAYTSKNDSNITIGYGVTWENNKDRFKKYGIESMKKDQKVKKSIVDQIKSDIISDDIDSIKKTLSENGLTLNNNQLYALVSRKYNTGNISGFVSTYKKYNGKFNVNEMKGMDSGLWKDYMSRPITGANDYCANGILLAGLAKRRVMEWILFTTGEYTKLDDIHVDDYPIYRGYNWDSCA